MNTRIPSVFCEGLAFQLCLMSFMRCSWSVSSIGPSGCPFRASIHFWGLPWLGIASQSQGKGFLVPGRTLPSKILQLPWSSCFGSLSQSIALGSLLCCLVFSCRSSWAFECFQYLLDSRVSCVGNKAPRRDVTIMFGYSHTPTRSLLLHTCSYIFTATPGPSDTMSSWPKPSIFPTVQMSTTRKAVWGR